MVNLLASDLSRDFQPARKRFAKPLPIQWQMICQAIVDLLANDLPGDCQSTGK
jgi:hypothetical protein